MTPAKKFEIEKAIRDAFYYLAVFDLTTEEKMTEDFNLNLYYQSLLEH